jgi:type VI secretion system secreted protein Hcp
MRRAVVLLLLGTLATLGLTACMSDDENESAASAQARRSAALVSTGPGNPGGYQLTIDGLTGTGKAIAVDAFSWGMANPGALATLSGAGSGKAEAKELNIRKTVDEMSPLLMKAAALGQQFKTATLSVAKPAGETTSGTPYLVLTLENVIISGFQVDGTNPELPGEAVSVSFGKITYRASGVDVKGGITPANEVGWNILQNEVQ